MGSPLKSLDCVGLKKSNHSKKGKRMKKISIYIITIVGAATLINWRGAEPTIDGNLKHKVNFSGTLTTHQGATYDVDNISFDRKYKQITMYDKPSEHPKPIFNKESKSQEIQLNVNPFKDYIATKIDLSETGKIQVPSPGTIWVYQKKKKHRKLKFTEVIVISKSNTKHHYLLERKTKVYCDEIDAAGPVEKIVPLPAIKSLKIDGYSFRDSIAGGAQAPKTKPVQTSI